MSHTISVEIDDEVARQIIELVHYDSFAALDSILLDELLSGLVRALEEDDG